MALAGSVRFPVDNAHAHASRWRNAFRGASVIVLD